MNNPPIVTVPTATWEKTCKDDNSWPQYAQVLGRKFAPGAFYFPPDGKVYAEEDVVAEAKAGTTWAVNLLIHEYMHANGLPYHPDGMLACVGEAFRYHFDVRSFTRLLRFTDGDAIAYANAKAWLRVALA